MTGAKVWIPLGMLALSALLMAFVLIPSSIFNISLASLMMFSKDEYLEHDDPQPLVMFKAGLEGITILSNMICLDMITPCTITYSELPSHPLYVLIGEFPGVPAAVHDILDYMGSFKSLIKRSFGCTCILTFVLLTGVLASKSKIYVQVPTQDTYEDLSKQLGGKQIQVYDDPQFLRFLLAIGGAFGMLELGTIIVRFASSGLNIYHCVSVITDAIARLPFPKGNETSLKIVWDVAVGSTAIIGSIFTLGLGSGLFFYSSITLKDRPVMYTSELVSAPQPPSYTYRINPVKKGRRDQNRTLHAIEDGNCLKSPSPSRKNVSNASTTMPSAKPHSNSPVPSPNKSAKSSPSKTANSPSPTKIGKDAALKKVPIVDKIEIPPRKRSAPTETRDLIN